MKLFETLTLDSLSSILEYYKPHYQELRKTPGGSVKDWFKAMGVEDEHVKAAMDEARQLDSYKKLASMFTVKFGGSLLNKNGTFSFRTANNNSYSVYGNGVIRQEGPRRGYANHFITKLKAPKPALVHGNPVKSLVKIYDNAFKELASKKLRESVDLNESVNFGKMQQAIYNYVLRKINGIPSVDAHDLAKNTDTFWVSEFDDALRDLERNDVNSALDSIAIAISAVSEAIVDWYSNKMNHAPGYKPVKLKSIKDVSEKDVMAILNELDPKMVERELALQKEEAEKHKALKAQDKAAASSKLSEIASILKKHEAAGWAEFARVIKKVATPKTAERFISDYMPKGTTEEELLAIKNAAQLKAFIKDKATDVEYVETLVANVNNLNISNIDYHLMSLATVVSRDARLSKKLAALVK